MQAARTPFSLDRNSGCNSDDNSSTELNSENLVICRVVLESRNSFITITPRDVTRSCSPGDCPQTIGSSVTVNVAGSFTFVTPLLSPFFGGTQTIDLNASATAQREFVPTPPPSAPFGTAAPTQLSGECTIQTGTYQGERGVFPPNVIGKAPNTAADLIRQKGLVPVAEGDLSSGSRNVVREQNPDTSICTKSGSEVHFKYRP